MKTKILFLWLLLLPMSVVTSFAESGITGSLTWILEDGTLTISGTGVMPDYDYPDYAPWYSFSSSIETVVMEDGVTNIGDYAFYACLSLTSVTIPNSVTNIGDGAFSSCNSLTVVNIPNSVTSIGNDAFSNCSNLTTVTIPNSVTSIGNSAFYWCDNLTGITIPNSVTSIGYGAFYGCTSLSAVNIPNSVTSIGGGFLRLYQPDRYYQFSPDPTKHPKFCI